MAVLSSPAPLSATVRTGLALSVVEGCFTQFPGAFTTGVFLTGFALMLGADPWAIGLLTAIPALGQVAQLFAAALLSRYDVRKPLTVWGASLGRYLWLLIAGVPFLPLGTQAKLGIFFALLCLSTVLTQAAGISWSDWMADFVPTALRGRYFGLRNAIGAGAGILIVWGGTRLLDGFKAAAVRPVGFAWLMLLVGVGALGSQIALSLQPEPARPPRPKAALKQAFQAPLRNRGFRRLMAGYCAWTFMCNLTTPFGYAYALKHLQVDYSVLGLQTIIITALGIVSQPLWGRVIDRKGAQAVLCLCLGPVVLNPFYWLVMRPGFILPLWIDAVAAGIFWVGMNLSISTLLMEVAPEGQRASYMGLFNTGVGLATSLAAACGGALLSVLGERTYMVCGHPLLAMQLIFLAGGFARLACFAGLRTLPRVAAPTLQIDTWAATEAPLATQAEVA